MSVLRVVLREDASKALRRLCKLERRTLQAQAALLIQCGLDRAGFLEAQADRRPQSDDDQQEMRHRIIAKDFQHGADFQCGHRCIIESDVVVGHNVKLGHNVLLKSGTRIGDRVEIADNCCTTGVCLIGNDVMVRTGSCISKSVILDDFVFVGAGVMSSHTKNVYHGRPAMDKRQLVTRVGYGAIIGSSVNLMAGVTIAPGVIVGYGANVTGDLLPAHGLYFGNPARFVQSVAGSAWAIDVPSDYDELEFESGLLEKYLPFWRVE